METSIHDAVSAKFNYRGSSLLAPVSSVWRSSSSLFLFSWLGCHGSSLFLSPPVLLPNGWTGRSGLPRACPVSLCRCLSGARSSRYEEHSLFLLCIVTHIFLSESKGLHLNGLLEGQDMLYKNTVKKVLVILNQRCTSQWLKVRSFNYVNAVKASLLRSLWMWVGLSCVSGCLFNHANKSYSLNCTTLNTQHLASTWCEGTV